MPQTNCASIRVGPVNVANPAADCHQSLRHVCLLDVHVKKIAQQPDMIQAANVTKSSSGGLLVEEIRLVAVERFVQNYLTVPAGSIAEQSQRFGQPVESHVARHIPCTCALHGSDNHRRPPFACHIDQFCNEVASPLPNGRIGMAQMEFVLDPARACANSRQRERTACEQSVNCLSWKRLSAFRKDLDTIKAQFGRSQTATLKPLVKDKRPLLCLGNQTDCDSRLHTAKPCLILPICGGCHRFFKEGEEVAIQDVVGDVSPHNIWMGLEQVGVATALLGRHLKGHVQ